MQFIENMIDKEVDDQKEKSEIKDSSPKPVRSRQLRSSRNSLLMDELPEKPQLALKPCNNPYNDPQKPLLKMLIRRPVIEKNREVQRTVNSETSTDHCTNDNREQELIDTSAQSLPKLPDDGQPSPKASDKRQLSPYSQDMQLFGIPEVDDCGIEIEVEVQPEFIEKKGSPSKIQTSEQVPQPNPVKERSASVTLDEYLLIEARLHKIHTGEDKVANDTQKLGLPQNSTVSTPFRPLSVVSQPCQHEYAQPLPVSSPYSKSQLQETTGTSSGVTHSNQNFYLQNRVRTIPSCTSYSSSPIDLSSQRQVPIIRKKSSPQIKKSMGKKICLRNITKNMPSSQQSLYSNQLVNYASNVGNVIDPRCSLQSMNTFGTQDSSPSQLQYLQYIAPMQETINRTHIPYVDQRSYNQNSMGGRYVSQNQTNQIKQSGQFLPQPQNQYPEIHTSPMQELMRYKFLNGSTDKAHGGFAAQSIQSSAQSQLPKNLEDSQRRDLPSYEHLQTVNQLEFQSNYVYNKHQVTENKLLAVSKTSSHQLSDGHESYSCKDRLANSTLKPINNFVICEPASKIIQDFKVQTTSSQSQEAKSKQVPEKNIHNYLDSKKLVVANATEVEFIIDLHRKDENIANAPKPMDSGYETNKNVTKKEESRQDVPDSEMMSKDDDLLDNVFTDGPDYTMNGNIDSEEDISSLSLTKKRSIDVHNFIPKPQQKLSKMAEKELLKAHNLLVTRMSKYFMKTEDFNNHLRGTTLNSLKTYDTRLNKVKKST